ncbi:MarC family protein [Ferrimonas pelagia]|uniref:UPF0056 membrane protein n=1 Tax=Ferrimonas pelagia TaxID=1177826 RepID=A0ABP9EXT3_9GAMM
MPGVSVLSLFAITVLPRQCALLLAAMQVPLAAFQATSGRVLFAQSMICGESKPATETKLENVDLWSQAVLPLAIPSIASPRAILASVLLTDNARDAVSQQAVTALIMWVVMIATLLLLLLPPVRSRR